MITFEVIRDRLGFIAIEEAYTTLWGESGASVFQSHAWIMAWQKHLGQDFELVNRPKQNFELLIGVARGDGRLLAVLPMALHRYKGIKLLEWAAQSLSDNCDGFGLQVYFIQIWRAILAAGKPDIIRLKNVRPDAKAVAFLDGCGLTEIPDDLCLLVQSQWPNGEAWFKTLNKKNATTIPGRGASCKTWAQSRVSECQRCLVDGKRTRYIPICSLLAWACRRKSVGSQITFRAFPRCASALWGRVSNMLPARSARHLDGWEDGGWSGCIACSKIPRGSGNAI
jgi:hypothetical protein